MGDAPASLAQALLQYGPERLYLWLSVLFSSVRDGVSVRPDLVTMIQETSLLIQIVNWVVGGGFGLGGKFSAAQALG